MEQLDLFDLSENDYKIKKPIRLIELFAGIGSQAMALRDLHANFETWKVVEFDRYAIASYNAIHNTNYSVQDITKTHAEDLNIIDTDKYEYIMTYSFPCQDLSLAGKQRGMTKGSNTRSGLLWEVERLLKECKTLPQILVMENVIQVHSKRNIVDFQSWLDFLSSKGYRNFYQDLNAKDYGIPQSRRRCFMVSILDTDSNFSFPEAVPLSKNVENFLENAVEDKFYIKSDKAKALIKELVDKEKIKKEREIIDLVAHNSTTLDILPCIVARYDAGITNHSKERAGVIEKRCKQVGSLDLEHYESCNRVYDPKFCSPTITTMQGGNREIKMLETVNIKQATKEGYIECKVGGVANFSYPTSKIRRGRVINGGNVSPTLTTNDNSGICKIEKDEVNKDYRIRKLTPLECWRLMGFTDEDYKKAEKVNSKTQLYKQAGNSIVKNVLMAIFEKLIF